MTLSNLRTPTQDSLVDSRGFATRQFQNWMNALTQNLSASSAFLVITQLGSAGNGGDDTALFQQAVTQLATGGGGVLFIPAGVYNISTVTVPVGTAGITFLGAGPATVINRRQNLAASHGMFDVYGSNVVFSNLVLDGQVTVPVGLLYNQDFAGPAGLNDPMAASLTTNTSVWVHGPGSNYVFDNIEIRHTGGYTILFDMRTGGGISGVRISGCRFNNNRPNLFGIPGGDAIYGSWTGGIFAAGDGRSGQPGGILKHILMEGCTFERNTGNCFWQHIMGFDQLHEDFRVIGNSFTDCGLDGILIGGVAGGAVVGNSLRRVGYITMNETDTPVPRWLAGLNATAIDSSGLVKSVVYANNVMISVNGGGIDGDGHGLSSFTGNVIRMPYPGEPEYDEDSIAISGPNNNGNSGYGFNIGNSQGIEYGAEDLTIVGNTLINLPSGAVRMFATRRTLFESNTIIVPAASFYPPITMGPTGPEPGKRCYGNKITGNHFDYSPAASAPCVVEEPWYGAFLPTEVNSVYNNNPITGNGTAIEFVKDPTSGSPVYSSQVWWP